MRSRRQDTNRRQRGFVAVETAMLLPVMLLVLLGLLDFGRFMWTRNVVMDAAAEGVRLAALAEPADSEVVGRVLAELQAGGVHTVPTVTVGSRLPDQPVNVDVSVPFNLWIMPGLLAGVSDSLAISVSSVMMHER